MIIWLSLFWLSLLVLMIVFGGYPLMLYIYSFLKKAPNVVLQDRYVPKVSILVVFRNAENLIEAKIKNYEELLYPSENLELILISDGSTDNSYSKISEFLPNRDDITFKHFDDHSGKIACLNYGMEKCTGEIVIFTDVDAILSANSVNELVKHFPDKSVGGICGQRIVGEISSAIKSGQDKYIQWDSLIKKLEMKSGVSISSHDGKLYAIRKDLFEQVPDGVTDDSFICYTVIKKGYLFSFESEAKAYIKTPSRTTSHEITRRIRIVSTSLNGLLINRALFNPFRYGFFTFGLFINKILRRILPITLLVFLASSFASAKFGFVLGQMFFACQMFAYILSLFFIILPKPTDKSSKVLKLIYKISGVGYFFCVGMFGTLLGTLTFLSGKKITKWDPVKGSK